MKEVLKNVVKSMAITCLVLNLLMAVYYGMYYNTLNKAIDNGEQDINEYLINTGKRVYEGDDIQSEDEKNREIGIFAAVIPNYARYEISAVVLFFSIVIGSIIGTTVTVYGETRKKIAIKLILLYVFIVLVRVLFEVILTGAINTTSLMRSMLDLLCVYLIIFVLTFLIKKLAIKRADKQSAKN